MMLLRFSFRLRRYPLADGQQPAPVFAWADVIEVSARDGRDRWRALCFKAGTDLFDDRGPAAHLAERTRLQLQYGYGKFLAFLGARHPSLLTRTPAERVNRKIIEDYVKWQPATCGGGIPMKRARKLYLPYVRLLPKNSVFFGPGRRAPIGGHIHCGPS